MAPHTPADNFRANAALFSGVVDAVPADAWDSPSPVEEWAARDVVAHLIDWPRGFLASGADVDLPAGPGVADDPAAAWAHHRETLQALLDDPATPTRMLDNPHVGEIPVDQAIDQFYTPDVFMHLWDLAKATGQPVPMDEQTCAEMLAGMEPLDEMLRQSGQYGTKVEVPPDASAVDRLMGFIGRDPQKWA